MTRETALKLEEAQRDYADARLNERSVTIDEIARELRELRMAGDRIRTLVGGLTLTRDPSYGGALFNDHFIDSIVDGLSHAFDCLEAEAVLRASAKHDPSMVRRAPLQRPKPCRQIDAEVRVMPSEDIEAALAGERIGGHP